MNDREYRSQPGAPILTEGQEGSMIEGYAVHWNSPCTKPKVINRNGKPFPYWEQIAPHAFAQGLAQGLDVICTFDHETSKVLGRLRSQTLEVKEDDQGLFYRCRLPDTSYASDLKASLKRGDVFGNSFGMYVLEDEWSKADDGLKLRTVTNAIAFDVSPVTEPTYEDAEVALRSIDRFPSLFEARRPDPWIEHTGFKIRLLDRHVLPRATWIVP